jgi:hypothetical protein
VLHRVPVRFPDVAQIHQLLGQRGGQDLDVDPVRRPYGVLGQGQRSLPLVLQLGDAQVPGRCARIGQLAVEAVVAQPGGQCRIRGAGPL